MNITWINALNDLSKHINNLYGFVRVKDNNFGEPAINSGPCGTFANAFYQAWNKQFDTKVNIALIMTNDLSECWHIAIRLPNGMLFDGGCGVYSEKKYSSKFKIEDMKNYNLALLDERSYGLDRKYPRYCPDFSINEVEKIIESYLEKISGDEINKM
jgi:hypothetical protein